jgi:hypothetical protein
MAMFGTLSRLRGSSAWQRVFAGNWPGVILTVGMHAWALIRI